MRGKPRTSFKFGTFCFVSWDSEREVLKQVLYSTETKKFPVFRLQQICRDAISSHLEMPFATISVNRRFPREISCIVYELSGSFVDAINTITVINVTCWLLTRLRYVCWARNTRTNMMRRVFSFDWKEMYFIIVEEGITEREEASVRCGFFSLWG